MESASAVGCAEWRDFGSIAALAVIRERNQTTPRRLEQASKRNGYTVSEMDIERAGRKSLPFLHRLGRLRNG